MDEEEPEAWYLMIPSGVFATQGKDGIGIADSVGASHINGMVLDKYRKSYAELQGMGLTDHQIKEVWSIAHDFERDEVEVAQLMLIVRDTNAALIVRKGQPIEVVTDATMPLQFGHTRMERHAQMAKTIADFSKKFSTGNEPVFKPRNKKKETFSQRYDRLVREARQQKKK